MLSPSFTSGVGFDLQVMSLNSRIRMQSTPSLLGLITGHDKIEIVFWSNRSKLEFVVLIIFNKWR
jgi:hypothetical protein